MADWKPMSEDELAEIEAREKAATPGPWEMRRGGNFTDFGAAGFVSYCEAHSNSGTPLKVGSTNWPWNNDDRDGVRRRAEADAEFIANSRADVPRLVAELRRTREALREAREDTARLEHAMLRMMIVTDCGPQTVRVYDTRGAIDQHRSKAEAEPRG